MFTALCCLCAGLAGNPRFAQGEAQKPPHMQNEFLVGADVSMLRKIEELGGVFRKGGRPQDALSILKSYGCNCFRLRLFVNPNYKEGVVNDLPYTLALAKRVKAVGAKLLLDFHYSDTWSDPGKQFKPAAWAGLDFDALERKVEEYTAQVITQFKAEGVLPDIVQVGNEITPGMLWPEGKLYGEGTNPDERWDRFTRLLKAGIRGVKKPLEATDHVRIMIHIDRGGDWKATKWFFDNLTKHHVDFDIIGQSYYPWWHGTMDAVRENLNATAKAFGKDIVIVETAYPYRNAEAWTKQKNMAWPISPDGQKQFLRELIRTVRSAPDGHGLGVIYWYPESLPVQGMEIWNGGATALFDAQGNALPALEAFCAGQ